MTRSQQHLWRMGRPASSGVAPPATGGGGGGGPAWVPANAKIHIDFLGGTPQGRAWTEGTGVVGIETLLGNDEVIDDGLGGTSTYDISKLTPEGYRPAPLYTAFIGAARAKIIAGVTLRYVVKYAAGGLSAGPLYLAVDDSYGVESVMSDDVGVSSWSGPTNVSVDGICTHSVGAINVVAITTAGLRFEGAANGNSSVLAAVLTEEDFPSPPVAAAFASTGAAYQSITLYNPVPIGSLPGLSV